MNRNTLKWLAFPGINLHARLRYRVLPRFFGAAGPGEDRLVLDAGCGNGMLTYQAYRRGNPVVGVSIKADEVERCRALFNTHLGIPESRLSFRVANLYELPKMNLQFDQIICSEVLEHLVRDGDVCRSFWNVLKPGGVLHLCCPNADHPDNAAHPLDLAEQGGHVRPGYTMDAYRALLEPLGFRIVESAGIGGPVRQWFNKRIIRAQQSGHPFRGLLLFALALPLLWLDSETPATPYSLYIRAVKERS